MRLHLTQGSDRSQSEVTHRTIATAQSLRTPGIWSAKSAARGQSVAVNGTWNQQLLSVCPCRKRHPWDPAIQATKPEQEPKQMDRNICALSTTALCWWSMTPLKPRYFYIRAATRAR